MKHRWVLGACAALLVCAVGCGADSGDEAIVIDEGGGDEGLGKGDSTVGPIVALRCDTSEAFVQKGGFVEVNVDARDSSGAVSRNFTLEIVPQTNARVVQRNKVFFDETGEYEIHCLANDSDKRDETAVMVGHLEPALAVSNRKFVEGDRVRITGRALASDGGGVRIDVDGIVFQTEADGSFDVTMPAEPGVNRYVFTAVDRAGRKSDRITWAVVGEFGSLDAPAPDVAWVTLGPGSYPDVATIIEQIFVNLPAADLTGSTDQVEFRDLLQSSSGEKLGVDWEFHPRVLSAALPDVTLGAEAGGIRANVFFTSVSLDALVRTKIFSWKDRDMLAVVNNLRIGGLVRVGGLSDLSLSEISVEWDSMDLDLSDMPGWVEDLFVSFFEDKVRNKIADAILEGSNKGLDGVMLGFETTEELDLPAPLLGPLVAEAALTGLSADADGMKVGLALTVDGETDPLRMDAPGPIRIGPATTAPARSPAYGASLGLAPVNDLFFAAWQTGALDIAIDIDTNVGGNTAEIPALRGGVVFIDPKLPPVVTTGSQPGELLLTLGGMRIDAAFETSVGMVNAGATVGGQARILLTGGADELTAEVSILSTDIDLLVAPLDLEVDAVESIFEALLRERVMKDISQVAKVVPLPKSDLSKLELGLSQLTIENVSFVTPAAGGALQANADVVVR